MAIIENCVNGVFSAVAHTLKRIAKLTDLTYNEVNVILYYLLIPLSWAVLFDIWLEIPLTTVLVLLIWTNIFITKHSEFRQWCDTVFKGSVRFLSSFENFGLNYNLSSVIICVIVPILIYIGLIFLAMS